MSPGEHAFFNTDACEVELDLRDSSHMWKKTDFIIFYTTNVSNVEQRMYTTIYWGLFVLWHIVLDLTSHYGLQTSKDLVYLFNILTVCETWTTSNGGEI